MLTIIIKLLFTHSQKENDIDTAEAISQLLKVNTTLKKLYFEVLSSIERKMRMLTK